jgi:hypothetical protein
MINRFCVFLFFVLNFWQSLFAQSSDLKPRIIVLTDVSSWETDDSESLVRLLVHADLYEIEGLVYTTGWSLETTNDEFFGLIGDAVNAYEKDLPNLLKHTDQKGHLSNENQQKLGYWPSAEYLQKRTIYGSKNRGMEFIGEGNDSPGSDLIIQMADEDDERPVWVLGWGGANTLAQAIWRVKKDRTQEQLQKFLQKVRLYAITDQDRSYKSGTSYDISAHQWMRREFEKELFFIWDESAWKYQNGTGKDQWDQYAEHIQNHGNLGAVYPKYKFGVEGDTPAFLYLMPNGLNNTEMPNQASWGGYFEWGLCADNLTNAFTNHIGASEAISHKYMKYFYPAMFNNFAARMDWAANGVGNRNPIVNINGNEGIEIIEINAKAGSSINLNASKSNDPDGDELKFNWWILKEAGTYSNEIVFPDSHTEKLKFEIPSDASGKTIHVICEVTDNGMPVLTSYRRIILKIKN